MRIKHLLHRRYVIVSIDIPNLKLAVESADKKVILVDLIEDRRVLVVVDLVFNALASSLNIDIADQNLLIVEAGNSKDRR